MKTLIKDFNFFLVVNGYDKELDLYNNKFREVPVSKLRVLASEYLRLVWNFLLPDEEKVELFNLINNEPDDDICDMGSAWIQKNDSEFRKSLNNTERCNESSDYVYCSVYYSDKAYTQCHYGSADELIFEFGGFMVDCILSRSLDSIFNDVSFDVGGRPIKKSGTLAQAIQSVKDVFSELNEKYILTDGLDSSTVSVTFNFSSK